MTIKGYVCAFVLAGALLGPAVSSSLAAETLRSDIVEIPYRFQVSGATLPAGQYRLEERSDSNLCTLVNTKSGESISILRPTSVRTPGKVQFVFHETSHGVKLQLV